MSKALQRKQAQRKDALEEHNAALEKSLNTFSLKLIKVFGVIMAIMGLCIIGAFWYWIFRYLFRLAAN